MSNEKEQKENKEECTCREIEKELAMSYYSQDDGNTYRLPFLAGEAKNGVHLFLPDGGRVCYEKGIISRLLTGNRLFEYTLDLERGVLTETEIVADNEEEVTRHINIFTLTSWTRFQCDPNTYITNNGEEVHFCLSDPEPDYEGRIVKIIDPYGEEFSFDR